MELGADFDTSLRVEVEADILSDGEDDGFDSFDDSWAESDVDSGCCRSAVFDSVPWELVVACTH